VVQAADVRTAGLRTAGVQASDAGANSIGRALTVLGDQWTLLILQRAFLGVRRFGEWRDALGISEPVLAARLRALVGHGVLATTPYLNGRVRDEYQLTERGLELWSLLVAIWSWERRWSHSLLPDLIHEGCHRAVDMQLCCAACSQPADARHMETVRAADARFDRSLPPRKHRRTSLNRLPHDNLSYLPETMELLGNRWSTAVLAAAFLRTRRFRDFSAELGIPPSTLAGRLHRFVQLGVFRAEPDPESGRQQYRLTQKGLDFFPVFSLLIAWGDRWLADRPPPLQLTHRDCGSPFRPELHCTECGQPLARREVHFSAVDVHTG
jgi:DNA-binding HxlR family transcriptional regulator